MTISTSASKVVALGNGITVAFSFSFLIPQSGEEQVIFTDALGNQTVLSNTLYALIGFGNPAGGTVTYPLSGSPIPTGTSLTIARVLPLVQGTTISNQGAFYPQVVEGALDYEMMVSQQLNQTLKQAILAPIVDQNPMGQLPAAAQRAGKYLAFDSNGNPIATGAASTINSLTLNGATSGTLVVAPQPVASGVLAFPNGNDTLIGRATIDTLTGAKTFNPNTLIVAGATSGTTLLNATAIASGTLTLPAATDTLVGRATTDTLTNKTFDTAGTGNSLLINGLAATANTGTGAVVRAIGPAIDLTNATGLPLTSGVTGLLPIANGGTNANAANGARSNLGVPTWKSYSNIPGLNTALDGALICNDINLGYSGAFAWVGSSLTTKTILQSQTTTSIAGNVITLAGHGLSTGAGILTTTAVNGLATQTVYWVINLSSSTFSLATTVENAINSVVLTLTGTTNFTFQQLLDPLQDIYVIPTGSDLAGSNGAWVRAGGQTNAAAFRGNINRFNDRLFLGTGATRWMGDHSGTTSSSGVGSWLYDENPSGSTVRMSYLLINAALASVPDFNAQPTYAVVGASRTPTGSTTRNALGVAGYGSGWATSGSTIAWGGYFEGRKNAGSNTTTQGIEIDASNANSTPLAGTPSSAWTYTQGQTMGIFLASGGGNSAGVYDADFALLMSPNGAKFRSGITILSTALTQDASTNYQHALILPSKARVEWNTSDGLGNYAFTIHSEISNTAHQMFAIASDTGLVINNTGGNAIFTIGYVASAVNSIIINPNVTTASPQIQVSGSDTNIDLSLIGKGTGGIRLRDGAAANKFQINTTGIGFYAATPVAKPTVSGAKGSNAALGSLMTALSSLGLVTDSTSA